MDWFMLAAMVIAGWSVLSVIAGERMSRQRPASSAAPSPAPSGGPSGGPAVN